MSLDGATDEATILSVNGGSSSIKFALYRNAAPPVRLLHGSLGRIGAAHAALHIVDANGDSHPGPSIPAHDVAAAAQGLIDWLDAQPGSASIAGVGHRVVHGMRHVDPERVTPELLAELHRIEIYDPEHLPGEIALIEAFARRWPGVAQVACFDTAFHRDLPPVASVLPIPRRYAAQGVRRYGFHGLSYAYLMEELERVAGRVVAGGRVILAHLGNGASLAAVQGGRSIDTSMGFTPSAGLPMGTRSGDLDPGLAAYLERTEGMSAGRFHAMASRESGLLGVSETSADMRELLACEGSDPRAAEAVALFCYQAKKWIGAYAAALGGLDTLVFSGGIGEHAAAVRERICAGLGFLGIALDAPGNAAHDDVISTPDGRVSVRVIRTDEELMIARSVGRVLGLAA